MQVPSPSHSSFVQRLPSSWHGVPNGSRQLSATSSQVFAFDNGNSMMPLCLARPDGVHYRLAADEMEALAPLANIDELEDRAWTTEWVEGLFEQLRITLSPEQRTLIREAVDSLAESTSSSEERTLTALRAFLQDRTLQEAFKTYTGGAAGRVLNGKRSDLRSGRFTVFDIDPATAKAWGDALAQWGSSQGSNA